MQRPVFDLRKIHYKEYAAGEMPRLIRCLKARHPGIAGEGGIWQEGVRERRETLIVRIPVVKVSGRGPAGRPAVTGEENAR